MSPFLRQVPTASGATTVQIVRKWRGQRTILEYLGSAHTDAELAALIAVGKDKLAVYGTQQQLDLGLDSKGQAPSLMAPRQAVGSASRILAEAITGAYRRLGFTEAIGDEAFFQLVWARVVEPTSKLASIRVLADLGIDPPHHNTLLNALARAQARDYRSRIAEACFAHSVATAGVALCLYDVTTLYFKAEKEDDLRKVGYSKERRVGPQVVVGLLMDRAGFPLETSCFEGNRAETHTLIPVIQAFQNRHGISDMVVVADAGMLSAANLKKLDAAGPRFIVGSRQTKAPTDVATHFRWHGTHASDGQTVDTLTPRDRKPLDPTRTDRRAEPVWSPTQYRRRGGRCGSTGANARYAMSRP